MARAGEVVNEGRVLATLDDKDLALERLRWSTTKRQHMSEYDRALALKERAEANIIKTRIDQAGAQIELLDKQLARTLIKAPFDGIIVSGDLSQSVGAAVKRGEELFNIAPLDDYRVILEVDETDIKDVQEGQEGLLRLASAPEVAQKFSVVRITPISEQADGRNFFRVEARLHEKNNSLRPGMEGIGKVEIDERLLIRIWTDKMIDWLRLNVWKWMP
jgi:multidrug resistance efflux pump